MPCPYYGLPRQAGGSHDGVSSGARNLRHLTPTLRITPETRVARPGAALLSIFPVPSLHGAIIISSRRKPRRSCRQRPQFNTITASSQRATVISIRHSSYSNLSSVVSITFNRQINIGSTQEVAVSTFAATSDEAGFRLAGGGRGRHPEASLGGSRHVRSDRRLRVHPRLDGGLGVDRRWHRLSDLSGLRQRRRPRRGEICLPQLFGDRGG